LEAIQEKSESPPSGAPGTKGLMKSRSGGQPVSSQQDKSRGASLPELKRVIVAFGNRLVMEENLDKALSRVLGKQISTEQSTEQLAAPLVPQTQDFSNRGVLALEYYNKAKDYLRQGNWAGYGRELENLEKLLNDMSRGENMDQRSEVSD